MITIQYASDARRIKGLDARSDLAISITETPSVIGGSAGTETVKDVVYTTQVGAGSANNFRINVSDSSVLPGYSISVDPASTGVCSLDASGNVTWLSDGLATININARSGKRQVSRQMVLSGSATVRTGISSLAMGSLFKYLADQSAAALAVVTPATVADQSSQLWSGGAQTTNALLTAIAAGVDFSPYLNTTWISNKHYAIAAHVGGFGRYNTSYYSNLDGSPLLFATPTTQVLLQGTQVAFGSYMKVVGGDIGIIYAPGGWWGTAVCKTLPANWQSYLPTFNDTARVPAWVSLGNISTRVPGATGPWVCPMDMVSAWSFDQPNDSLRTRFKPANPSDIPVGFIGGDSNSPLFMVINGQPVLLGHVNFGGLSSQLLYHQNVAAINQAMNDLSAAYIADGGTDAANGTYALTAVDLSGFNTYN